MTEDSPLATEANRDTLLAEWGRYWNLERPVLVEKSPPNLLKLRFLQALFPEASFVVIMRHPIVVSYATQKWSETSLESLLEHWHVCHEIFLEDAPRVRRLVLVRYEDFVADPAGVVGRIQEQLGLHPRKRHSRRAPGSTTTTSSAGAPDSGPATAPAPGARPAVRGAGEPVRLQPARAGARDAEPASEVASSSGGSRPPAELLAERPGRRRVSAPDSRARAQVPQSSGELPPDRRVLRRAAPGSELERIGAEVVSRLPFTGRELGIDVPGGCGSRGSGAGPNGSPRALRGPPAISPCRPRAARSCARPSGDSRRGRRRWARCGRGTATA